MAQQKVTRPCQSLEHNAKSVSFHSRSSLFARLSKGRADSHVSHVKGPIWNILLERLEVCVFLSPTRVLDTGSPALSDDHSSSRVNRHHLTEYLSSNLSFPRCASQVDFAGLTALVKRVLHFV